METNYINEFIHLAQNCNFQETAADFYISQSTLTKHIQAIEQELGVTLFDRTTRKCALSKYGKFFLPYAKQMTSLVNTCTNAVAAEKKRDDLRVDFGVLGYMHVYGIYRILADFITANSSMRYNVTEDRDSELREMLSTGTIQFALTPFVNQYPGANHILWCHDSFVLMCPPSHPFASLSFIDITQLKDEQMLIHGMPVDYTNFFAVCEEHGFKPKVKTISFNSAIAMLVEQQQELAIVNEEGLSSVNCSNVVIVPIVPESGYDIYLIYHDEQKMTRAGRTFLSFFTSHQKKYFPTVSSDT